MLEAVISLKFFSLFSCRQECVHSPFYIRVCTLINSTLVLHQLFFPVNIAPDLFILYHIHKQNLTRKPGNTTFGGITAAITANAVLVAYIVVAWKEDQGERLAEQKRKEKKAQ